MQQIIRFGAKPAIKGPADWFTGSVRIDTIVQGVEPGRAGVGLVNFEPGARSHWHTHPLGQILLVVSGKGWTQCEGGPKKEIRAGDVVSCGCNQRHWHGATDTTAMSHFAVTELLDGSNVTWMEAVTDDVFNAPVVED
jgi:quercetin dioxygenase-like cupin family protein